MIPIIFYFIFIATIVGLPATIILDIFAYKNKNSIKGFVYAIIGSVILLLTLWIEAEFMNSTITFTLISTSTNVIIASMFLIFSNLISIYILFAQFQIVYPIIIYIIYMIIRNIAENKIKRVSK